jgi:septum formation protein
MHLAKPLILASRSPRRLQLLRQIGLTPEVIPCDIEEIFDPSRSPGENAVDLALAKAKVAAGSVEQGCVLGADTIVSVDGVLLGKPGNRDEARSMLRLLSGRTHRVHTGYAVIDCPSGRTITGCEETLVQFRDLPDEEIAEYVDGGSPMDKAGAYGIQDDYGAVFVRRVEGCYYNVVGLPLSAVYTVMMELGIVIPHEKEQSG